MAKWQRHLRLQPEWGKAADGEITPQELARSIATRLRAMRPLADSSSESARHDLVYDFDSIAGNPDADVEDFDYLMDRLYDWGDTPLDTQWNGRKACWVDTSHPTPR